MARTAWTRVWTMMPRACGVQTSSRASRRRWRSTPPAAGGKSSSRMRARCTVSDGGEAKPPAPNPHWGITFKHPPTAEAASLSASQSWTREVAVTRIPSLCLALPPAPSLSRPCRKDWFGEAVGQGAGAGLRGQHQPSCSRVPPHRSQPFPTGPGGGQHPVVRATNPPRATCTWLSCQWLCWRQQGWLAPLVQ